MHDFVVADAVCVLTFLYPECVKKREPLFAAVDLQSTLCRGTLCIDWYKVANYAHIRHYHHHTHHHHRDVDQRHLLVAQPNIELMHDCDRQVFIDRLRAALAN